MNLTNVQRSAFDVFIEALKQTPRDWMIENLGACGVHGSIRCADGHCPYIQVDILTSGYDVSIIENLNSNNIAGKIWRAADGASVHDPEIRAALLEACGLS